jgi:uncharacterized protein
MKKRALTCFVIIGMGLIQMVPISRGNDSAPTVDRGEVSKGKPASTLVFLGGKSLRATIADTKKTLTEGLLEWPEISEEDGMLLDFTLPGQYAIHMQGMKFPIDALWIDAQGVIKLIYEDIPPNSGRVYPSLFPCRYCLEIKAGYCHKYGVKAGQTVRLGVWAP